MEATLKSYWRDQFARDGQAYARMAGEDPFQGWERNAMPEALADRRFTYGCEVRFADGEARLWKELFAQVGQIRERALRERKLESPECKVRYPWNLAKIQEVAELSSAILGTQWNVDVLQSAADSYREWCADFKASEWDSQAQSHWLTGVRLALLAGGLEKANELLRSRRSFGAHKEEHAILKLLATGDSSEALRMRAVTFLSAIKDPRVKFAGFLPRNVVRVEIAALISMYLDSNADRIDWDAVFETLTA
jgi:hypothetical protein